MSFSKCEDGEEDELITQFENKKFSLECKKEDLEEKRSSWEGRKAELEKENVNGKEYTKLLDSGIESYDQQIADISEKLDVVDDEIASLKEKKKERKAAADSGIRLGGGFMLKGSALAIGPDRIEISALVNHHDCGGPVVNMSHEVIGIFTYLTTGSRLPDWVIEGTRFEDARLFALKIENIEWMPMDGSTYRKETDFIQENLDTLSAFAQITESLSESYFHKISIPIENKDVQEWIDRHNKLAEKYSEARNEYYRPSGARKANKYFRRNFGRDLEALAEMIEALEKDAGRVHRVSIPSYKERLADLETFYANVRKRMELIVENL